MEINYTSIIVKINGATIQTVKKNGYKVVKIVLKMRYHVVNALSVVADLHKLCKLCTINFYYVLV